MLDEIVRNAPFFFLVAVRAIALVESAPLLSSEAVPQIARVSLAGFAAFCCYRLAPAQYAGTEAFSLDFAALVVGEALIGIIMGFYLNVIFSAFSSAGQFFSLQMGFGASETYDPLAQIENPLMGQYLNLIAMLVFISIGGFRETFLAGFQRSLESISAIELVAARQGFLDLMLAGLSNLFVDALIISLPILGTLFLVSVATGLLSKAAPQMNLLTEGFPITITIAFVLILATMPFLVEAFARVIGSAFTQLEQAMAAAGGGI